ncbi:MAG: hypothetical protein SAL70_15760 [Scytonema sp. PMC 1070.18]|nr:hypothetical protein [Scytonema sp. PMC 1070.18]
MKYLASKIHNKRNVFFGEADSFTVIKQRISQEVLLRELKLACLLYDHVILAAAYFWQSKRVYSLIPEIEVLIQNGDVLPAIRDYTQTRDAKDYLDKRIEESSALVTDSPVYQIPLIASEIAKPTQRPVANELNRIGTFLHIDTGSIEAIFRRLWLDDIHNIKNPNSISNIIEMAPSEIYKRSLIKHLNRVCSGQYFSRSIIASYLLNLPIDRDLKSALIQRASELYLLSNAITVNSDLLVSSKPTNSLYTPSSNLLGSLSRSNVNIFAKFLEICDLSISNIDEMTGVDIINLKSSKEFVAFRDLYNSLLESALLEKKILVNEVVQQFFELKREEKQKKVLIRILNVLEFVSSGVFINTLSSIILPGFSPVAPALTIGSGVAATASYFLKKIGRIKSTPILDFTDSIKEGKFRNSLYKNVLTLRFRDNDFIG